MRRQAPAATRPRLDRDLDVDVAIVGAGYTGLWTAFYLLETDPHLRLAVLEAERVGFGASGRNGGWCSAKVSAINRLKASAKTRTVAVALQREMFATVDEVGRVVEHEEIACDWVKGGTLVVATCPAHVHRLRAGLESEHALGFGVEDYRWLEPREAATRVRTRTNMGATFTPHCAAVDPAALVRGLATAVERRGGHIYERTRVASLTEGALRTAGGSVRASVTVLATEAYTVHLDGADQRSVAPVYSLMIATEPLGPELWQEVGLRQRETFADGRRLIVYGQRTADGRLAFGGRGAPYHYGSRIAARFDQEPQVFERLRRSLVDLFPVLDDIGVDDAWGGPLGISRDWLPSIDRRGSVAWARGFGGQGVAAANLAGRALRDLVLDLDGPLRALPIVGRTSRRWEPEPLRWMGINAGLWLAASADRHESRTGTEARLRGAVLSRLVGL